MKRSFRDVEEDAATLSLSCCAPRWRARPRKLLPHTHAHAPVHGRPRSAAQRSATQCNAARSARNTGSTGIKALSLEVGAGSHGHVHAPAGTRAESPRRSSRTVDGRFDVAAALCCLFAIPNTFRYIRFSRAPLFLPSLHLSFSPLYANIAFDRRLTAAFFFPSTCSPFRSFASLFLSVYADIYSMNFILHYLFHFLLTYRLDFPLDSRG